MEHYRGSTNQKVKAINENRRGRNIMQLSETLISLQLIENEISIFQIHNSLDIHYLKELEAEAERLRKQLRNG